MAKLPDSGSGKYGVYIVFDDGDTEKAWRETKEDRDRVYRNTKGSPGIKSIKKIER